MRRRHASFLVAKAAADAICEGRPVPAAAASSRRHHREDDEQETLFQKWVPTQLARFPQLALLHAIPNGGKRVTITTKKGTFSPEAARMKRQGVRKGVPDLDLPVASIDRISSMVPRYIGLRIEMKHSWAKGERKPETSPEQREWLTALQDAGHCCCLCYGWEQAAESITAYLTGEPVPHQWSKP